MHDWLLRGDTNTDRSPAAHLAEDTAGGEEPEAQGRGGQPIQPAQPSLKQHAQIHKL
jgi:hypothetical protein